MENPREIIDDKYQAFIDNDSIHMNYTKLEYVYKSYIGLLDKPDILHSIDLITIFTFTALDSFMTYKTNQ